MSLVLRVLCFLCLGGVMFAPATVSADGARRTTVTYYHPSLHGFRMANGLPYDRWNASIAATNWYPLGTFLKVTRQGTDEFIFVRVQDRGSPQLTIDLSEAGFGRLGALSEGRIPVWAEVLTAADVLPAPPAAPVEAPDAGAPDAADPDKASTAPGDEPMESPDPHGVEETTPPHVGPPPLLDPGPVIAWSARGVRPSML